MFLNDMGKWAQKLKWAPLTIWAKKPFISPPAVSANTKRMEQKTPSSRYQGWGGPRLQRITRTLQPQCPQAPSSRPWGGCGTQQRRARGVGRGCLG